MRTLPSLVVLLSVLATAAAAQDSDPAVTSWRRNIDDTKGSGGTAGIHAMVSQIEADVQASSYTSASTYVEATGVPSHTVGPFAFGPTGVTNQGYGFRIPRQPTPAPGAHTATPLGPIAAMVNGVPAFNAKDAHSYQNQGIWNQNAIYWEGLTFDTALGHPTPFGTYHYHQHPELLQAQEGDNGVDHSPIIGFAFDGYPIYGPYGYANPHGTGGITRMRTSYRLRNITQRHVLPDGTNLPPHLWGPDVLPQFPLSAYVEDYEYVGGLGDLDQYNGRTCVSPEYPSGTYAYFATLDANGDSAYPYLIGPEYYGVVDTGNIGPGGGHISVPAGASAFTPFELYQTGFISGSMATISVANADPNATLGLLLSGTGLGPLPAGFGVLDLSPPIILLGVFQTDANGFLSLSAQVPVGLSGITVYSQAVSVSSGWTISRGERVRIL